MTSVRRGHISRLIKKYSGDCSTEALISFVADTDGMLPACKVMLQDIEAGDNGSVEWLQLECKSHKVTSHSFLEEISRIVALFHPDQNVQNHYATLGISTESGFDEIKKAYRTLSLQYHPDTASLQNRHDPDKFIQITKAYHSLLAMHQNHSEGENSNLDAETNNWRKTRQRSVSVEQRQKVYIFAAGLLLVLVVVSVISAINYKKRAMIVGLQESRGDFVRPVEATVTEPPIEKTNEQLSENGVEDQKDIEKNEPLLVDRAETHAESPAEGKRVVSDIKEQEDGSALKKAVPVVYLYNEQESYDYDLDESDSDAEPETNLVVGQTKTEDIKSEVVEPAVSPQALEGSPPKKPLPEELSTTGEKKRQEPDLRSRIDLFLADYINAYEQANIILFAKKFRTDAMENGEMFTAVLPTYIDLFSSVSELAMEVAVLSWQKSDKGIVVRGRFKVNLHYKDSRKISGFGSIQFLLTDISGELRIAALDYDFNAD